MKTIEELAKALENGALLHIDTDNTDRWLQLKRSDGIGGQGDFILIESQLHPVPEDAAGAVAELLRVAEDRRTFLSPVDVAVNPAEYADADSVDLLYGTARRVTA